jgi:hypothetical protein
MKTCVQIDFQLLGTKITPKEITKILGVVPEVELLRGERNNAKDLPRQNTWAIRSAAESDELEDHWESLRPLLNKSRDAVRDIAMTGRAKFTLIIDSKDRVPSITIPPSMSEFAGYINAVIDIDHIQS